MTVGAMGDTRADGPQALATPSAPASLGLLTCDDALSPEGRDILDAVLDAVTVGVVVQQRDGTPLLTNRAARTLLDGLPDGVLTAMAAGASAPATRPIPLPPMTPMTPMPAAGGLQGAARQLLATTVPLAFGLDRIAALVTTLRPDPGA